MYIFPNLLDLTLRRALPLLIYPLNLLLAKIRGSNLPNFNPFTAKFLEKTEANNQLAFQL